MPSRLASRYPDIQSVFEAQSPFGQKQLATRIVLWAAHEAGIDPDEVSALLSQHHAAQLDALCMEMDARYFELLDRQDSRHQLFFCKARAYSAGALLARDTWDDAIYESTFATEKPLLIHEFL
ncbi:hypothetical protein [Pseudomonas caspiana]|uniref:Uncharacterized protein n=1 Tax=Pseudomonas caspiana TaxID=1451454 RepID=A0A1Y3NTT1_9PSED|nr:hypothetical protein [Pseudomonas caspiana]OUM71026.1 hypothetical protein AUC60_25565 [Pseudomonas caspiana]